MCFFIDKERILTYNMPTGDVPHRMTDSCYPPEMSLSH